MSEDNEGTNPDPKPTEDPLKNFKSEMDRKMTNFDTKVDQMAKTNQELLAQIKALTAPPVPEPAVDEFDDLFLDNPKEAARKIKEDAVAEMRAEMQVQQEGQQKQARILTQLTQKFPELNDPNSELTKKAVELYNEMDAADQTDPKSYRIAVGDAALELGIQPLSKRKKVEDDDDDGYAVSPSSNPKVGKTKIEKLDPNTIEVARLMGLDVENEKVLESLKSKAKRTNWSTYQ